MAAMSLGDLAGIDLQNQSGSMVYSQLWSFLISVASDTSGGLRNLAR